jgi:glycosyltransferase involved in cell wall biosynthesis
MALFGAYNINMKNQDYQRILIFIVAYNAQKTIASVLARIPVSLTHKYSIEVLIIDDESKDRTFLVGREAIDDLGLPFPVTILKNPQNQGYGGNQKIGYHYAIEFEFDYVALIHGDGQYAPEALPALLDSFNMGNIGAVFGSRMLIPGAALTGGMPLYKYIGNKLLTGFENSLLGSSFSEFHSGYRIYAVRALQQIPFDLNTNDFHFDTEIIIQFVACGLKIIEKPIPTYYGDEICHVNGLKYAKDVVKAVLRYRVQQLGIFYDRRYDVKPQEQESSAQYQIKSDGVSPHTLTFSVVKPRSRVIDLGCASAYVGIWLQENSQCHVVGVDHYEHPNQSQLKQYIRHHIAEGVPASLDPQTFDYILMLDVIEHLASPERFVQSLRQQLQSVPRAQLLVSTGNVAFVITRLMLLFGQFNYGKRGILDMTHTRLFTFSSLKQLFEQSGFEIIYERGVPVPVGLIFKSKWFVNSLLWVNEVLIKISRGLFSYQIYMIIRPKPGLGYLLRRAYEHSVTLK